MTSPITVSQKRNSKKSIFLKVLLGLLAAFIIVYLLLLFVFIPERDTHPFFTHYDEPLIIAHQGGYHLAPSSSIAAFDKAVEIGTHVLEYDLHITKDGYLALIHDPTVDRTTNGTGEVASMTLEEVQALDAGYSFQDLNGEHSYRDQSVYIPDVREMFERYSDKLHMIEIKDTNPYDRMDEIITTLWNLVEEFNMQDKVLIAAFDSFILDRVTELTNGQAATGGGKKETTNFVITHKFFLQPFYFPKVDSFQLPLAQAGFDLTDKKLIRGAERLNQQVHYWTINDKDVMLKLLEKGAHGIITDRPDLLHEAIEEYKANN
ncbi:glycerophosphodiester phosphodiesterase [Anaerobacillus alkaliphilus]|uniref:Glycerophosphodiester phosphodiesterase n=1 Tax=Anaerobacillus alkaliphilus TaxID=1548597 RepID=A0A4Q0VKY3_9BACI|nr:glycerophosphodiester phosphodiesterase [Anaerobacillus alkaliphilus]RXI96157.1 glycerophosphodiester phosphodiesterase [Anaerobacillus alkaliphilus]